ncbi:MAG: MFS transporter [Propionibacteriaceae bacterium]|nr:MFS transporter [Propionibacteriaceae bacterium]
MPDTLAQDATPPSTPASPSPSPNAAPPHRAWPLLVVIQFLNMMGMTLVIPVLPFVTLEYVHSEASLAWWVGVLEAVFALASFAVAPLLGALSDRFGRRPVLIYSVFGAAVGYVLFGVGGSLAMLALARVVQGLASGDMPAIFGYVADITPPEDRARRFGFLGAVGGVAMMVGPAIGGVLAKVNLSAPLFATAGIAALIGLISWIVLPESLAPANRTPRVVLKHLHPFKVIKDVFARPALRPLMTGAALITLPFIFFTNNSSVLALDTVGWGPTQFGVLMTVIGLLDIITQGALLPILLKRMGDRGVVMAGVIGQGVGCLGLAIAATLFGQLWLFVPAALIFAEGQGLSQAAMEGLMSSAVGPDEQGWMAGGFSSISSAMQIIGPLLCGWAYATLAHGAPYWLGAVLIAAAAIVLPRAGRPRVAA